MLPTFPINAKCSLIPLRIGLAAVLITSGGFLFAQTTSPPQQAGNTTSAEISARDVAPNFKVNVRLVQVKVVVRDREGRAVGTLQKQDFRLFDNGKPQPISRFSVEHPGSPSSATATADKASTQNSAGTVPHAISPPTRYVAYLFDDVHLRLADMMLVRNAARRHIAQLQSTDRAAIFTTSGQDNLDFTDDRARLQDDLLRLLPRPRRETSGAQCPNMTYYLADLIVHKQDPNAIGAATEDVLACQFENDTTFLRAAQAVVSSAAEAELNIGDAETRLSLGALKETIRRMSVMPGQRTIVLASPGFFVPEQQMELQQVMDEALQAGIVINSLDARGVYVPTAGLDASRRIDAPGSVVAIETLNESAAAATDSDVLAELADATGGIFFHNNNDLDEGFRRTGAVPESYYVLAFTPQNLKLDGKFHKLEVKLEQLKGVSIQARKGYFAPTHTADEKEQAKSDIEDALFSQEDSHDLPVRLNTQFFKVGEDQAKLAVLAHIEVKQLRYDKADGRNRGSLTVVSALFDRNGRFISAIQKNVEMRWKDETLESKLSSGITLRSSFDVKPGAYLVRLVVRDSRGELAAESGAVEIP